MKILSVRMENEKLTQISNESKRIKKIDDDNICRNIDDKKWN